MRDAQGQTINQTIAAVAADYLVRLLLTDNLERFQTYIDLNSGSVQSTTITPANVGKWRRRWAWLNRGYQIEIRLVIAGVPLFQTITGQ